MFGRKEKKLLKNFKIFLKNGLKINSNEIKLSDIHRLPQQPITKNGRPVHHPIIVKLSPVSTTSVEKSILCLFYCFSFALASILTARFNRRSIKERKNALFHARSGNGPLLTIHDKNLIFKSAKNLGQYNAMRKKSGSTNLNTYITDHLPAKFQEQRKLLLP